MASDPSGRRALLVARRRPLWLNPETFSAFSWHVWLPAPLSRPLQRAAALPALWKILRYRPAAIVFGTTSPANRILARAARALGLAARTATFDQFLTPADAAHFDRIFVYSPEEIARYPEPLRPRFRAIRYPAKTESLGLETSDDGSVFACGAHDRDWATFAEAARRLPAGTKVVIAAGGAQIPNPDPAWEILGRVPEAEYYARMARAAVVVLPLLESLVPHGHCDASAAGYLGKPVVSTLRATVDSYCGPEHSALVPPGDAAALAEAIGSLVADRERRAAMSAAALARRADFSLGAYASRVRELVGELADEVRAQDPREICGDVPLSWGDRLRYLGRNALWNVAGTLARLAPRRFARGVPDETSASPFRSLVDGFLSEELPRILGEAREISVLDVGGGSGYARGVLAAAGFRGRYLVVDPVPDGRFESRANPAFAADRVLAPFEEFSSPERFDLVLSVTSLEHVPAVDAAVRNAAVHRAPGGVEVHVVPAGASLAPYFWHGWRQFSRGRMRDVFGDGAEVYALGGLASFALQLFWCTVPERLTASDRLRRTRVYRALRRAAFAVDRALPILPLGYSAVRRG